MRTKEVVNKVENEEVKEVGMGTEAIWIWKPLLLLTVSQRPAAAVS
jgi:hypothetical protein